MNQFDVQAPNKVMDDELPDVIRFLLGEGRLDGHYFGSYPDNGEKYKRKYWWRKALREAWKSRPIQALGSSQQVENGDKELIQELVEALKCVYYKTPDGEVDTLIDEAIQKAQAAINGAV